MTEKRDAKRPDAASSPKAKKVAPKAKVGGGTSADEAENNANARKGAIFLGFVVIAYVIYLIFSGQMGTFISALSKVDLYWVGLAALCFVMYFIFGVLAYAVAVFIDHDSPVGIRDLMSVEASGIFFGNLTPMMMGAVPSQIIRLTRTGLDVGEASATQFSRFIMFQLGVVVFAAAMLLAKFQFFHDTYGDIVFLNLVVFGVHFLELIGLFAVCLLPGFVRRIGNGLVRFGARHGLVKNPDHWHTLIDEQVQKFSDDFKRSARDKGPMFVTFVVTMLQLAFLYMIPWFVLRAFGRNADFLECLAAGSMVQMVASAVPLPGGTGGAEGGFALFYGSLFGSSATAGYLIWRIVTFFAPTILSAPLLGLRSHGGPSIYQRWVRLTQGRSFAGATIRGGVPKKGVGSGSRRAGTGLQPGVASVDLKAMRERTKRMKEAAARKEAENAARKAKK